MKKKQEYSNSLVMMVIFILALPIALPPFFRIMFPAEETTTVEESKYLLVCGKESADEGYNANSSTYYINDEVQKNTINFFKTAPTVSQRIKEILTQYNVAPDSGIIMVEGEEGAETPTDAPSEGSTPQRSILDEIEFFKNIQGINFNETDAGISLEITNDSLVANEGNLELGSYLSDYNSLESFYTNMGYTCYKETL